MTDWYQRSINALPLNGKGERTQEAYTRAVRMLRTSLFQHGMSLNEGRCFQRGLSLERDVRVDHPGHGDRHERSTAEHGGPARGLSGGHA